MGGTSNMDWRDVKDIKADTVSCLVITSYGSNRDRGEGYTDTSDREIYRGQAKPFCTNLCRAFGDGGVGSGKSGDPVVWVDCHRIPTDWGVPQKKMYKEKHGWPMWQVAWNNAAANAKVALMFPSQKWIHSGHCESERELIESMFPPDNCVYVACDTTQVTRPYIEMLKKSGRHAFQCNAKEKDAAIHYITSLCGIRCIKSFDWSR